MKSGLEGFGRRIFSYLCIQLHASFVKCIVSIASSSSTSWWRTFLNRVSETATLGLSDPKT